MWIITELGFLSVVSFDPKMDSVPRSKRQIKSWGARPVLVRGRVEAHMQQLKPYWSKLRIEKDDSADYEFRAVMPRARWTDFLADMGDKIDYGSHFKEVVKDRCPGDGKAKGDFYSAMMGIWTRLASLQPDAPYAGKKYSWEMGGNKGWNYGTGSGYTAGGVKSAADSAAIFSGRGVAPVSGTLAGRSGYYDAAQKKWVEASATPNHYGTTNYKADTTEQTHNGAGQLSEGGSVYEAPNSVEELAKLLMLNEPGDIYIDLSTPEATYDMWALADNAYAGAPLTADEIMEILEEMVDDTRTNYEARNEYGALLHKMYSNLPLSIVDTDAGHLDVREIAQNLLADSGS